MRWTPPTTAPPSTPAPTDPGPLGGAGQRRRRIAAALLLGALATALCLIAGTVYDLWYDEAATIAAATRGWGDLLRLLRVVDAVHGLHYVIAHLSIDLLGVNALALRLPSALAVGATTALLVPLGARLGGPRHGGTRLGVLAALVFLALPRALWLGAEGRSFALAALAVTALTLVLLIARERADRRWWLGYAAVAALAIWLFAYAGLVVLAHAAFLLLRGPGAHPAGRRRFLAAAAGAALAVSPLALLALRQRGQLSWMAPLGPATYGEVLGQWFGGGFSWPDAIAARWTAAVLLAALLAGAVVLLRRRGDAPALLLPLLIVPTAVVLLASLWTPLYTGRYLAFCLPFVALVIASGIAALRRPPLRALALGVVMLLGLGALGARLVAPFPHPWSEAAAWIAEDRADAPAAVLHGRLDFPAGFRTDVIATAYPQAFATLDDATLLRTAAETAWLWDERAPLAEGVAGLGDADLLYLLGAERPGEFDPVLAGLEEQGWRQGAVQDLGAIVVRRFER